MLKLKFGLLLIAFAMLAACAKPIPMQPVPEKLSQATWQKFSQLTPAYTGAYNLSASLRYGKTDDMQRVTLLLWTNGTGPIRVDLMAGINTVVAKIRESQAGFMAYIPSEKKAIVHEGAGRVLLNLGIPMPFGVTEFAALAQNDFTQIFGQVLGLRPKYTAQGIAYTLAGGKLTGELTLDQAGQPVKFTDTTGWDMSITYSGQPPVPEQITLTYQDRQAILLIKKRTPMPKNYTDKQLEFALPPGTIIENPK